MRHNLHRRFKSRRKAEPNIAISIRIPLDVEEQPRRLLERHECSVPVLFAFALDALEAQSESTAA